MSDHIVEANKKDMAELAAELRDRDCVCWKECSQCRTRDEAAAALEAQARRIEELEARLNTVEEDAILGWRLASRFAENHLYPRKPEDLRT